MPSLSFWAGRVALLPQPVQLHLHLLELARPRRLHLKETEHEDDEDFREEAVDMFVLPEDERPLSHLRIGEEFHMMDKFACKKAKRSKEMWPVPVAPSAAVASNAPDAAAAADAAPRTPKGKKRFDLGAAAAKRANQADSDGLAKAMAE